MDYIFDKFKQGYWVIAMIFLAWLTINGLSQEIIVLPIVMVIAFTCGTMVRSTKLRSQLFGSACLFIIWVAIGMLYPNAADTDNLFVFASAFLGSIADFLVQMRIKYLDEQKKLSP